jgi:DNA-binding XRE family transcriptional regulator
VDTNGTYHEGGELPYTQNKFHKEIGLPERTAYTTEKGEPQLPAEQGN